MPYEELQHIWSKAEDLLSSTDASIVACPGYQSGFAVASAQDPAKPHVVTPLASGEVRCRGCPQYDRLSICSHTVAVAERKAILWKFLAWYKKNRDKANFSQAANQGMPNGRGKKGERAPRKQKSKHGQKAIPTDFVDRCQVPCSSSHTVTASTSCSPAQPTSEMMQAASVQSMVSAMPMTTTGVQSDRSIQAVSAMHTAVSQPATPSQSMPPLPSTLTGSCMQSAAIAIQPAPVQSMVSAMPMTTIRSDGCIQALSAMHMAASQPGSQCQHCPLKVHGCSLQPSPCNQQQPGSQFLSRDTTESHNILIPQTTCYHITIATHLFCSSNMATLGSVLVVVGQLTRDLVSHRTWYFSIWRGINTPLVIPLSPLSTLQVKRGLTITMPGRHVY